jgi:hypothetical protein
MIFSFTFCTGHLSDLDEPDLMKSIVVDRTEQCQCDQGFVFSITQIGFIRRKEFERRGKNKGQLCLRLLKIMKEGTSGSKSIYSLKYSNYDTVTRMSDSRRSVRLDIRFIDHYSAQLVITLNHSAIADLHNRCYIHTSVLNFLLDVSW